MSSLKGILINRWRSISQDWARVSARIGWAEKLGLAAIFCALASISGLYFTEGVQKSREVKALEQQRDDRLEEAARAWAIQQTLLELRADGAGAHSVTKPRPISSFLTEARERLGLPPIPSPKKSTVTLFNYPLAPGTQLRSTLMALAGRGALALLIISILLLLAIPLILFAKNIFAIGERKAQDVFASSDSQKPPSQGNTATTSFPVPIGGPSSPGGAPNSPGGGGGMFPGGFIPGVRQMLTPTLAAAGAVIVIGAILITVPGRQTSVTPDVHLPNVRLAIDDFDVAVQPGRIDIPAAQIIPSAPQVRTSVPTVQLVFPGLPEQQEALKTLTAELGEYRKTLSQLEAHDVSLAQRQEEISRLQEEISHLMAENATLQTGLKLRPTQEQLDSLLAELKEQKQATAESKQVLSSLENPLSSLASAAGNQQYGDRLAARQYARKLAAQIEGRINQRLRPRLVYGNCATYYEMTNEVPDLRDLPACLKLGFQKTPHPGPQVKTASNKVTPGTSEGKN